MTSWCIMLMSIVWLWMTSSISSSAATSTFQEEPNRGIQRQAESSSSSFILDPGQVHVESHVFDDVNNAVLDLSQLTFTANKSDGHAEENLLLEVAVVPVPPKVCPVDYQNVLECDLMALGISTIVWDEEHQVRQLQWCNRQERLALRDDLYPGEYFAVGVASSSSSLETAKVSIPTDTPRPVTYLVVLAYCQKPSSSSSLPSIQVDGSIQYLEQGEKAAKENQKPTDQDETDDNVDESDSPPTDHTEPVQQEATSTTPSSLSPFGRFVILCVFGYVLYRFYNYWMGLASGAGHSYAAPTAGAPFAGRRGYDTVDTFELRAV